MNKYFISLTIMLCASVSTACAQQRPSSYVNPFVGATTNTTLAKAYHGLGKTYPGAVAPFGMVQVSPNTVTGGDNSCGYSYEHTSIEGFAFTQMSGVGWYGDLGNFLVMPTTGGVKTFAGTLDNPDEGYRSRYDKQSETARAGYYSVLLTDYGIRAEATALPHSGMLRFTYPASRDAHIQVDLARRVGGTSVWQTVEIVGGNAIRGMMRCTPEGGGWGNGSGKADYTVYYYAEFSRPFKSHGVWEAAIPNGRSRKLEDIQSEEYRDYARNAKLTPGAMRHEGKHIGFYADFDTRAGEQILMKAGISFTSLENAEANLKAEMPGWDFDGYRDECAALWDAELSKVSVSGGTDEERRVFYTALYHTLLDPRLCSDVNGEYLGADNKVHQTAAFNKRTIFSGWDVFRSQMPLQTIINPTVVNDMLNSLIEIASQSGNEYLERWELLNAYSGCMLGNPAISVLCDAYSKGIRGYDVEKAYRYALNTSRRFGNNDEGWSPGGNGVSLTLEYAYSDWCMARLAEWLGKEDDRRRFDRRALAYGSTFDKEWGWFRPRDDQGRFMPLPGQGRMAEGYGCTESNLYQQGWFVPHDVDGMVALMGGRDKVLADLHPRPLPPAGRAWAYAEVDARHLPQRLPRPRYRPRGQRGRGADVGLVRACSLGHTPRVPRQRPVRNHQPRVQPHRVQPRPVIRQGQDIHHRGRRQLAGERLHTVGRAERQALQQDLHHARRHNERRHARIAHGRQARQAVTAQPLTVFYLPKGHELHAKRPPFTR